MSLRSRRPRLRGVLICALTALVALPRPAAHAAEGTEATAPTGILKVTSPQAGAEVWIDDEPAGPAPITRYLPVGSHTVRVAADGFNPTVREIQIAANRSAAVDAMLLPGNGTVEIKVDAPGSEVLIDGTSRSRLPVRLSNLSPGPHTFLIEAPGREPLEGSFEFITGKNLFMRQTLRSTAGLLEVQSKPEGAPVRLDGVLLGPSPVTRTDLPAGVHLLAVGGDGQPLQLKVVDTTDGSKAALNADLTGKPGDVKIRTPKDTSELRMAGQTLATGKSLILEDLAAGRYNVEVQVPGYHPANGRLEVEPGRRTTYKMDLVESSERGRSQLVQLPPWYGRWTTWAAIGGGVVLAGGTSALVYALTRPEPPATPDLTVSLP